MRTRALAALLLSACGEEALPAPTPNPPAAPTSFEAVALTGGPVALRWQPAPGALTHELERATVADQVFRPLAALGVPVRSYVDSVTVPGESYTYRIRATNAVGPGAFSEASAVASAPPPVGPHVSVTPDLATLAPNGKLAFGATVDGSRTQPVTWIVLEGPPGGAVGSTGAYRAPNKIGDFHLIALSPASVGGMATIEVR